MSTPPLSPISAPLSPKNHQTTFELVRSRLICSGALLERFIGICKLRVHQETSSADLAEKFFKKRTNTFHTSAVVDALDLISSNVSKKSSQSRQFVEDVSKEVIEPIERTKMGHDKLFDTIERDGSRIYRKLQSEQKHHDEAFLKFEKSYRRAKALSNHEGGELSSRIDYALACSESGLREQEYHMAVFRLNQIQKEYTESMSVIIVQMEDLELSRLNLVKDGIDKLMVYEFALNRGIQYELETCVKELEKLAINVSGEISDFVKANKKDEVLTDVVIVSGQEAFGKVNNVDEYEEIISVEKKVIDAIWSSDDSHQISSDIIEALDEPFNSRIGRLSFCFALSKQPPEVPGPINLTNLGRVLNKALSAAENEMDSETGRLIASFSLFFFYTLETGKRKFIQAEIYHHTIWNRIQFWEETLALVICDELVSGFDSTKFSPIPLDRFGNYILIFGINPNSAIDICKRVVSNLFNSLPTKGHILQRLISSVKSAQERQERNVQQLQASNPVTPQRVFSPNISV